MQDVCFGVVPILKSSGKILLVESLRGEWGLPKGHKEISDQTDEACALRELAEETGITECELLPGKRYEISYTMFQNGSERRKSVCFFPGFVEIPEVAPAPGEIQSAVWFTYEDALKKVGFEDVRTVIMRAYRDVGFAK